MIGSFDSEGGTILLPCFEGGEKQFVNKDDQNK